MKRTLPFVASLALTGCGWLGLGWGALSYPTTEAGESANVVASGDVAYATRGADGIEVIDLADAAARRTIAAAPGTTVDDLAIADNLLFALDAHAPGHLAVYSLADPRAPALVQQPVAVPVGPFSGVSAANGLVIVSGGTSLLTLRRYGRDGRLDAQAVTADLGRGQPDVLVTPDGGHAIVSVHDEGPMFSLVVLALASEPPGLQKLARLRLDSYGFTPGGARPASFPIESATSGSLLYNASADGLRIIDLADPAQPRELARLTLPALPVNVDVRGTLAAVVGSDPAPTLSLVDVADPAKPRILRNIALPPRSLATGVALTEKHVLVAAHGAGTLVFDLDSLNR